MKTTDEWESKIREEMKTVIQGYVPTITNHKSGKPKVVYAAFTGGTTKNFLEAFCEPSIEKTFAIARRQCKSIWDLPSATPVDGNCELVVE